VGKPGATTPLPDKPDDQTETEEELLCRLVALNTARAAEEAQGQIRWLRPNYQSPGHGSGPAGDAQQVEIETRDEEATAPATKADKHPWPPGLPEQVALVARVLAESPVPLTEPALAARFSGRGPWKKRLPQLLETLVALGRARRVGDAFGSAA